MIRPVLHLLLHIIVPAAIAAKFYPDRWKNAWVILVSTMLVDLDHLLAEAVYDPSRCSIGFHPLHTYPAIGLYMVLAVIPKTRLVGLGLVIHMALDMIDCLTM